MNNKVYIFIDFVKLFFLEIYICFKPTFLIVQNIWYNKDSQEFWKLLLPELQLSSLTNVYEGAYEVRVKHSMRQIS